MEHKCLRCQHSWISRTDGRPVVCPNCKSPYWDKENIRVTRREKELLDRIKILEGIIKEGQNNG